MNELQTKHDPYCDCGICQYCNGQEDRYGNPSPPTTPTEDAKALEDAMDAVLEYETNAE